MKAPSIESVTATARSIRSKLRKAGFTMSVRDKKTGRMTAGYYVHRLGCSRTLVVAYRAGADYYDPIHGYGIRAEIDRLVVFLRAKGYDVNCKNEIVCKYDW